MRRRVKAPKFMTMHGRYPLWHLAYSDPGGTIFGPGPYLKLPMTGDDGDLSDQTTHRVRPPGGYENRTVKLEKGEDGWWYWIIEYGHTP